jgi:hypothetical protein
MTLIETLEAHGWKEDRTDTRMANGRKYSTLYVEKNGVILDGATALYRVYESMGMPSQMIYEREGDYAEDWLSGEDVAEYHE